jgi:hypothetical protein
MPKKKTKTNRRATRKGKRRAVVIDSEPKMSKLLLDLADPLIDGDVSDPKLVDAIVRITIAAWNKAMAPADRQPALEKEILDAMVGPDGNAEQAAAIRRAMEIIEDRRRKLVPDLRRVILAYDLQVFEGAVALNVVSEDVVQNQ